MTTWGARCALGIALRGTGDHAGARRNYRQVLEADPEHTGALFNMGILLAEFVDQRPRARRFFERFIEAAPANHPRRGDAERYLQEIPAPRARGQR